MLKFRKLELFLLKNSIDEGMMEIDSTVKKKYGSNTL